MELHEFHISNLGAGPVGGGHAVPCGHRGIRGFSVNHADPAAGQDCLLCPDQELVALGTMDEGAGTGPLVGQQVRSERLIPDGNVRSLLSTVDDRPHHFVSRGITKSVHNAAMAVAAFPR